MDLVTDNVSGQYLIHLAPNLSQQQQQQKNWKLPDKILQTDKHLGSQGEFFALYFIMIEVTQTNDSGEFYCKMAALR